jgi:ABC-type glycerol-3-phosphate transport system substrate-binding protein
MTNSVGRLKAITHHFRMLLALAAVGAVAVVLAACGASGSASQHPNVPPKHGAATTPAAPPAPSHTANPIPQNNGGDHDADNNGGPSDGDGNI